MKQKKADGVDVSVHHHHYNHGLLLTSGRHNDNGGGARNMTRKTW